MGCDVWRRFAGAITGVLVACVLAPALARSRLWQAVLLGVVSLPLGAGLFGIIISWVHWIVMQTTGVHYRFVMEVVEPPGYVFGPLKAGREYAFYSTFSAFAFLFVPLALLTTLHLRRRILRATATCAGNHPKAPGIFPLINVMLYALACSTTGAAELRIETASSSAIPPLAIDPARKEFFAADKVVRLDITVDEAGMQVLRETKHPWFERSPGQGANSLPEKPYVKGTVVEDGTVVHRNVGVRLRGGMGSWQKIDEKPGLFLNMDKFEKSQRFHGMEKVILHNSHQDPRYMNELLTGEVYRAAGVPAARVVHAVVSLNGRRLGLYYLKEGYDAGFLKEHFGNDNGYMYQGDTGQDINAALEITRGEESPHTPKDHSDLKLLMAALNEIDPKKRFERASLILDVNRFMKYLAASVVLGVVDAYPIVGNNYRIYFDTRIGKLVFFPSGVDRCDFGGVQLEQNFALVASRLIETPDGRAQYLAAVDQVLAHAYDPKTLVERIDSLRRMLNPVLKECHPVQHQSWDVNFWIRDAIQKQPAKVTEMLRRSRGK